MDKKFWKCKICGDIHYGAAGPEVCPTCMAKKAYESVDMAAAMKAMGL